MIRRIISAGVLLSALIFSNVSVADIPSKIFRLHMSSTFVEVGTGETSDDNSGDQQYSGLEIGLGMSRFGIGAGVGIGKKFILGGKLAMGQEASDWWPGSEGEMFMFSAIPYFEVVFLTTRVRPFVKAIAGIEGARGENDAGFWGLVMGGGGGLHIFLTQSVSFDVDLEMGFRFGTGHDGPDPGPGQPDNDYSHWRFNFATLVGLSAWL